MSFLNIENLSLKLSGNLVLQNLNLNLERGDRCVLIGINGSGKTCLLRTLAGNHMIDEGKLVIDRRTCFQDQCHGIAFLGESWSRTVSFAGHSIAYQADIMVKNMMRKVQENHPKRKAEIMEVLGINPNWRMHLVSSGQRRRVRLFLGLIKPFKLALIDEMTMDLDIVTRKRFMDWLKKESIVNKATIIYATHIFDGLNGWPTHIAHMIPGGCIGSLVTGFNDLNIAEYALSKMTEDYIELEKNNILEKEDGGGALELSRNSCVSNGKQRGYSSGRSSNIEI